MKEQPEDYSSSVDSLNRDESTECFTCKSNLGIRRISPGPTIYRGKHWLIEHAYPCQIKGWLVIIAKEHVEALHELTAEAFSELAEFIEKTTKILRESLGDEGCKKEYVVCFAEAKHFYHIHFHIIPRPVNLPDTERGPKIFAQLKIKKEDAVPRKEVEEFCKYLQSKFE